MAHIGSWGLPDLGVTEWIQKTFSPQTAYASSGGSNILPDQNNTYSSTPIQWNALQSYPAGTPTPATAPTSGGGATTNPQEPTQPSAPSGPSLEDELNGIFNPVFNALSGQESTLRENYAPVEGQIQAQGDLSLESIGQEREQGLRQLGSEEQGAGKRRDNALTSAIRLTDELKRGGIQRFGGASSAGEAFQTLTAVEQQRRQGSILDLYEGAMQKVGEYKATLEEKFALAQKEVKLQIQQALSDAQAQFRDALQQIQNNRFAAESDKANAKLSMLQELRNKVYTINQQSLSFLQQMAANKEATLKQVDAFTQKVGQSVLGGSQTVASLNFPGANQTSYSAATQPQTSGTYSPIGSISYKKDEEDLYA